MYQNHLSPPRPLLLLNSPPLLHQHCISTLTPDCMHALLSISPPSPPSHPFHSHQPPLPTTGPIWPDRTCVPSVGWYTMCMTLKRIPTASSLQLIFVHLPLVFVESHRTITIIHVGRQGSPLVRFSPEPALSKQSMKTFENISFSFLNSSLYVTDGARCADRSLKGAAE
jgi:hypothetical protein